MVTHAASAGGVPSASRSAASRAIEGAGAIYGVSTFGPHRQDPTVDSTAVLILLAVVVVALTAVVSVVMIGGLLAVLRRAKDAPPQDRDRDASAPDGTTPDNHQQVFHHDSFGTWD